MLPELFHVGSFSLPTYGVLLAIGFLLSLTLFRARAQALGISGDAATDLGVWMLLGGLGGAKLLLIVVEWPAYVTSVRAFLGLFRAAGVFYGGLIGAIVVGAWLMRKKGLDFWTTADAASPAVALGQAIGRLGCFAAGCCWGAECHHPWAVTFTSELAARNVGVPLGVPLHPTQLYEALGTGILCVLLVAIGGKLSRGRTFATYLVLYALLRGTIELFRGDPRGFMGVLSTSQLIAIVGLLAGLVLFVVRRPPAPSPSPA